MWQKFTRDGHLGMALYCAQIVLGAGVLTISFQVRHVGLLPLLVGMVVMALAAIRLYSRVAATASSGTSLGSALTASGAGRSGRRLATFGMAAYSIGACVGYACLARTGLHNIVQEMAFLAELGPAVIGATWLAAFAAIRLFPLRRGRTLLVLAVAWLPGIALAGEFPGYSDGILLLTFVSGVLLLRWQRPRVASTRVSAHEGAISAMRTQLVLMAGLALSGIAVVVVVYGVPRTPMLLPEGVRGSGIVEAVGVLMFAMVGVGWNNLGVYHEMQTAAVRRRIIAASMGIVLAVASTWLVLTTLVLAPADLDELDNGRSFTTAGIATLIQHNTPLGLPAVLAANVALLLAVSGACSGFLEGLGTEIRENPRSRLRAVSVNTVVSGLLLLVAAGAAAVQVADLSTSQVLSTAGIVGGGVVMFIVPLLCEPIPFRRNVMAASATIISTAVAAMALYQAWSPDGPPVVTALNLGLACLLVPLTVSAAIASIRSRNAKRAIGPRDGADRLA